MKLHTIYGPPGTGKTTTLVGIVRQLLAKDASVAYLSYSKAAATEATSRIEDDRLTTSTLHSLAFRALGMTRQQVLGKPELKKFGNMIGIPFSGAEANTDEEQQEGDEYMAALQYSRNTLVTPEQGYENSGSPGSADRYRMFVESYVKYKAEYGFSDFDDMIERAKSLSRFPQFGAIILDEAQDLTPLQWQFFKLLAERCNRVYLAGDDDQAIYEWNGADPHGMERFTDEHKGTISTLDKSFRVPASVHARADGLVRSIKKRVDKKFAPRLGEGSVKEYDSVEDVYKDVYAKDGESSVMFLARDRFQMQDTKLMLNHHNIPYSVNGGFSNWTGKWADGIRALTWAVKGEETDLAAIKRALKPGLTVQEAVRIGDWRKVFEVQPFLRPFYENVDLMQPIRTRVSTVHQAKGQEADKVIVDLRMSARGEREIYAGNKARDAEYRVWYVAMTRAREDLLLCGENPLI